MKCRYIFYGFLILASCTHTTLKSGIAPDEWQSRTDQFGSTLLHNVVAYGYHNVVALLLLQNFSVDKQNNFGETALHINAIQGDATITKLLLAYNPDISIRNRAKKTALEIALERNHLTIAQLLSAYQTEKNALSHDAETSDD